MKRTTKRMIIVIATAICAGTATFCVLQYSRLKHTPAPVEPEPIQETVQYQKSYLLSSEELRTASKSAYIIGTDIEAGVYQIYHSDPATGKYSYDVYKGFSCYGALTEDEVAKGKERPLLYEYSLHDQETDFNDGDFITLRNGELFFIENMAIMAIKIG